MTRTRPGLCLLLQCALLALACGGPEGHESEGRKVPRASAEAPAAPEPRVENAGAVKGTVTYAGPDTDEPVRMDGDPNCATLNPEPGDENRIAVRDGRLANVFVHVKSGLEGRKYPVPAEAKELDQQGCEYQPRVLGIMVGQALRVRNSDTTFHNVHAVPAKNPETNDPQPMPDMVLERRFLEPEVMVPFKCDVHPWMSAWVGVVEHPYYAVTGEDGAFEIGNLPPGTYTLEAWHETLGTATRQVAVAPAQTLEVAFDFKPKP